MPQEFQTLAQLLSHGFDTVIDVRSPAEFAEDHIPGAINLPAMSNEERAIVGTIYKQVSPFEAKKKGAAILARNTARHLDESLSHHDGAWRPLVYCWRGGQRSGSVTIILKQIGWRADTIAGGYQTFRRLVYAAMYEADVPHRFILLDGNTGSAKTEVLNRLPDLGLQILDLEGLARHRGSMLGAMAGGQPSQKAFETALACALAQMDPARPVVVEAESSKIGKLIVPPSVWKAMCTAPRIDISVPLEARVTFLNAAYRDIIDDPERLKARLQPLRFHRSHAVVDQWEAMIAEQDHHGLARSLILDHYDPAYEKSRSVHAPQVIATVRGSTLDTAGQDDLAAQVARVINGL